jgi:hypothetical protein
VNHLKEEWKDIEKFVNYEISKETLYNLDNAKDGTAIVVEGPIDVWRIGDGAVATFGVIYTQKQN